MSDFAAGGDARNSAYRVAPTIFAIVADTAGELNAREAAELSGGRIAAVERFAAAADRLAMQAAIDVILIDVTGADADSFDAVIPAVEHASESTGARIVAIFARTQIDAVAARLLDGDAQLLCEPTLAERVSALAIAGRGEAAIFSDIARESEAVRLRRLNDEVARIADTLARLTRSGDDAGVDTVRDSGLRYDAPPLRPTAGSGDVPPSRVREVIRVRRLRAQFFDRALFADPAWDMLLDLFAASLEQVRVSVSSLCIAADVPPTTALRWISTMTDAGLFVRQADPLDKRRAFIALTDKALRAMRGYFVTLHEG